MSCSRRLQTGAAELLFLVLDDDAEEAIAATRTYQAEVHGTSGQALQFERQVAEESGAIRTYGTMGERRHRGAETSSACSEAIFRYGREARQVQFYLQHGTARQTFAPRKIQMRCNSMSIVIPIVRSLEIPTQQDSVVVAPAPVSYRMAQAAQQT